MQWKYAAVLALAGGLSGCGPAPKPTTKGTPLHPAGGKEYEVLISAPSGHMDSVRAVFDSVFSVYYPMLNRPERWFSPTYIPLENVQSATLRHHTVFIVWPEPPDRIPRFLADAVGDSTANAFFARPHGFRVFRDLWAQGQQVWWWAAADPAHLRRTALQYQWQVIDSLDRHQARRIAEKLYRNGWQRDFARRMHQRWGYSLRLPTVYSVDKTVESADSPFTHFFWARTETKKTLSNIIGWGVRHGFDSFDVGRFVRWHDTMGRRYIPGPTEGSYFATEPRFIQWAPTSLGGLPAYEVRGFWRVEGDFMGGPYVAYVVPDGPQTIVVEGFLHAPGTFQKRFMKRLEIILHTFQKNHRP